MIRKFCRIFCVVFLIGDFHSSLSQFDSKKITQFKPSKNNGSIALLDDALHQASIRLIDQDLTFGEGHICSGSLISTRVVLTAARCLFNLNSKTPRHPSELIVVMGTINRYQRTSDTVVSRVTHIRYPISFDLETMRDDIGMLFLSHEIPENHLNIRPIELSWKPNTDIDLRGSVTGWELSTNGDISEQLLIANASIVQRINCTNNFEQPSITNSMICAKYKKIDKEICQSDVGAPLVHAGKQIGLASWAVSSCSKNNEQFAVYTDVAYHKEWIRSELTDGKNTDSSVWGLLGLLTLSWFAFNKKQKPSFRFIY